MQDAMQYLNLVATNSTGPAAILKYRIYHSGVEGLADQEPDYPFEDTPALQPQAQATQVEPQYQAQIQQKVQPQIPQPQGNNLLSFQSMLG